MLRCCCCRYPSEAVQVDFARAAVSELERLDFVERYAWFALQGVDTSTLFRGNNSITEVGTAYQYAHA